MDVRAVVAIVGAGLTLWMGAAWAQEQPRHASLEGVILRSGAGVPVAGARVTLVAAPPARGGGGRGTLPTDPGNAPPVGLPPGGVPAAPAARGAAASSPAPILPVLTDDNGRFSFANLDPGTYTLRVKANGYMAQDNRQRNTGSLGTSVTLIAGQNKTDVAVSLTPAGNISGRLRDSNEQPLPNVAVELLHVTYGSDGSKRLEPRGSTRTDDRGEYRIFWIPPGRYYLSANAPLNENGREAGIRNINTVPADIGVAFYPGAANPGGARAIDVPPGAELTAIDWVLPARPTGHRVRGRLVDAKTGKPPTKFVEVFLMELTPGFAMDRDPDRALGAPYGSSQYYDPATGVIEFRNVSPGTYAVTATIIVEGSFSSGPFGSQGTPPQTGSAIVNVADDDVDDVVVTVGLSGSLPGNLRAEGELPAAGPRGGRPRLGVQLAPLNPVSSPLFPGIVAGALVSPDGTFNLANLGPGAYRVNVSPLPANAYVKSAQLGGVDVLDSSLVVAGAISGNLDIVISANGGRVQGRLVDERAEPVPLAQIVLAPNRGRGRVDLFKTASTDATGRFSMTGVAPGDYKVFSWQSIEEYGWFDPEILEQSEPLGSPVHVSESSTETVEVKIIPAGGAQ